MATLTTRGWTLGVDAKHHTAEMHYQKQEGRLTCNVRVFVAISTLNGQEEWRRWVRMTITCGEAEELVYPRLLLTTEEMEELLAEHRDLFPEHASLPVFLHISNSSMLHQQWSS
jgi:hypothetical protein